MQRLLVVLGLLAACGDNIQPPPVEVSAGRLTARISPVPAQITLLLDGTEVWTTRAGAGVTGDEHAPPHGFAAIGTRATTVEMYFGSFKFTEQKDAEVWRPIDALADVTATPTGARFVLLADGDPVGTGRLVFETATRSGADPDAAGFPRHVRLELTAAPTAGAQRISLATPCPEDEHLVGLGGQSFDIDHRGETVPLWVQEDGIGKYPDPDDTYPGVWFLSGRKHSTHTPMPMVLSSKGYALALATDTRAVFALGSEVADAARFEAWENQLDLQIFIGDGPRGTPIAGAAARDALGHMVAWAGKPARPPLSIFAPWVDAIFGSANVRRIAQKLRAEGIPASAIWTEDYRGGEDTSTGYSLDEDWLIDRADYPDFEQLATELHDLGYAFLTYQNTFVYAEGEIHDEAVAGGYVLQTQDGEPYSFLGAKLTEGTKLLDLTNPAARAWATEKMSEVLTAGSDGWMADFAEWQPTDAVMHSGEDALAVHNRYPVDWLELSAEMLAPRPGRFEPIHFVRAAWLGSQPHTQVIWAGDQQTDWTDGDGLPSVIPMGINLGLAGFPYFGSDIAGYMSQGTQPTSEELFFRWTSFGALTPVMRTHHGRNARDNYQWESDAGATAHFRRWTRFHMQLASYLWGSSGSFERDGLPLMRLIALAYPDERWAWTTLDEYLLGDRILVAPIQVEGATSRSVTLPAGTWYPLLPPASPTTPAPALAGGVHTATASVTEIPAFVPAGTLLVLYPDGIDTPLAATVPSVTTTADIGGDREVWLFPGAAADPSHGRWHDHDGPAGPPQWAWTGRPADAAALTAATFNDAPVAVTTVAGVATVAVTGDGVLELAGGGTLTIERGDPLATTTVRVR